MTKPILFEAKLPKPIGAIAVDVWHAIMLAAVAFSGGAVAYVKSEPTATLFQSLSTVKGAEHFGLGMLVAGLTAVVLLGKQSFLGTAGDGPRAGSAGGSVVSLPKPPSGPTPPAAAREFATLPRRSLFAGFFRGAGVLAAIPILRGMQGMGALLVSSEACGLFPDAKTGGAGGVLKDLVGYLGDLLEAASTIWGAVSPYIPASVLAKAQAAYELVVGKVKDAQALAQAAASGLPSDGGAVDPAAALASAKSASEELFTLLGSYMGDGSPAAFDVSAAVLKLNKAHAAIAALK